MEGVIWKLKYYVDSNKIGKEEINKICFAHTVTMGPDESENPVTYSAAFVEDGCLKIIFREGKLGTNVDYALDNLTDALNAAPQPDGETLSVKARMGIEADYKEQSVAESKKFATMLAVDEFTLNPMFEENFEIMKKHSGDKDVRDDWEQNLGSFTQKYFEGCSWQMTNKKFGEDDMLQEGFQEAVEKNQIALRVVEELKKGSGYNECIIEDGVLYIQTQPKNFGTNVDYACQDIMDIL